MAKRERVCVERIELVLAALEVAPEGTNAFLWFNCHCCGPKDKMYIMPSKPAAEFLRGYLHNSSGQVVFEVVIIEPGEEELWKSKYFPRVVRV